MAWVRTNDSSLHPRPEKDTKVQGHCWHPLLSQAAMSDTSLDCSNSSLKPERRGGMHPQHSYCKSYCRSISLGIWKPYLHFTASLQSFVLRANGSLSNPCLFLPVFSTTYPCSDYILSLPLFAKESNSRSARSLAGAVRSTEHERVSMYTYRYILGTVDIIPIC